MPATTLTDLLNYMTPELPDCPIPLIIQDLKRAARKFAEKTDILFTALDPIVLRAGQTEYELPIGWTAMIKKVMEVRLNSASGVANGQKGSVLPVSEWEFYPGRDCNNNLLVLKHEPPETVRSGLEVDVVMVPFEDAEEFPDWYIQTWQDGIAGYAMFTLLKMKKKPWTDIDLGNYYLREFRDQMNKARIEARRRNKKTSGGFSA